MATTVDRPRISLAKSACVQAARVAISLRRLVILMIEQSVWFARARRAMWACAVTSAPRTTTAIRWPKVARVLNASATTTLT